MSFLTALAAGPSVRLLLVLAVHRNMSCLIALVADPSVRAAARRATLGTVTLVVISLAAVEAAAFVFGFAGAVCPLIGAITHQVTNFTAVVARFIIVPGSVLTLLALRTITLQMAFLSEFLICLI